jgi:hypothetical protein
VPEKIKGTLALIILKSIHTLISPKIVHKLYFIATTRHLILLPLEYHVVIIALLTNLQRFFFIA